MLQSCWFVNTACRGLIWLVCQGFADCFGSFLSNHGEKHPDPKSGRDLMYYVLSGRCNGPKLFLHFFLSFGHQSKTFATDPRFVELVIGSAQVLHPH